MREPQYEHDTEADAHGDNCAVTRWAARAAAASISLSFISQSLPQAAAAIAHASASCTECARTSCRHRARPSHPGAWRAASQSRPVVPADRPGLRPLYQGGAPVASAASAHSMRLGKSRTQRRLSSSLGLHSTRRWERRPSGDRRTHPRRSNRLSATTGLRRCPL
jgi:hypothetical protein